MLETSDERRRSLSDLMNWEGGLPLIMETELDPKSAKSLDSYEQVRTVVEASEKFVNDRWKVIYDELKSHHGRKMGCKSMTLHTIATGLNLVMSGSTSVSVGVITVGCNDPESNAHIPDRYRSTWSVTGNKKPSWFSGTTHYYIALPNFGDRVYGIDEVPHILTYIRAYVATLDMRLAANGL